MLESIALEKLGHLGGGEVPRTIAEGVHSVRSDPILGAEEAVSVAGVQILLLRRWL